MKEREELEKKERRHEGLRHIDIGDANEERKTNSTMGKDSSTSLSSSSRKVSKKRRRREKLHKSLEYNDTGNVLGEETTHLKEGGVLNIANSDSTEIKKSFDEPPVKDSVPERLFGSSDMTVDLSLNDGKAESSKKKRKKKSSHEVAESDSTRLVKIKTSNRKKDTYEVADSEPTGIKENLEEPMIKCPVSGNLSSVNEIINYTSMKEQGTDMVIHGISLKDEEVQTHKRMKRKKSYHQEKDSLHTSPPRHHITGSRRKLLILDVNGLLSDFVAYAPERCKPDIRIGRKSVFKRPFCEEFLQFCFQKFDVGVWSSRTRDNLDKAVDFLMGDSKQQLLFCWDQSYCTDTGFNALGTRGKPLFLKELRKLWENDRLGLPWEKGYYNESNTLLLDDTPYKALRNPPCTAIFPPPYRYNDKEDNSLGPGGSLRVYLEGLAAAENVQKYVERNPFGQRAVTEANASWGFYRKVRGDHS